MLHGHEHIRYASFSVYSNVLQTSFWQCKVFFWAFKRQLPARMCKKMCLIFADSFEDKKTNNDQQLRLQQSLMNF